MLGLFGDVRHTTPHFSSRSGNWLRLFANKFRLQAVAPCVVVYTSAHNANFGSAMFKATNRRLYETGRKLFADVMNICTATQLQAGAV